MEAVGWGIAYFAISACVYVIVSRNFYGNGVVKFVGVGGTVGSALFLHGAASAGSEEAVASALVYAFLCEIFVFFTTFVRSSVSVKLLLMLRQRPMPQSGIDGLYADDAMVSERIGKLITTGFLAMKDSLPVLTVKGRWLLSTFRTLKRFFKHEGPERTL